LRIRALPSGGSVDGDSEPWGGIYSERIIWIVSGPSESDLATAGGPTASFDDIDLDAGDTSCLILESIAIRSVCTRKPYIFAIPRINAGRTSFGSLSREVRASAVVEDRFVDGY
jgi:hypothetical protein